MKLWIGISAIGNDQEIGGHRSQNTTEESEVKKTGVGGQGSAKSLKTVDRDQLGFGTADEPKRSWLKTDPRKLIPEEDRSQKTGVRRQKEKGRRQKSGARSQKRKHIKQKAKKQDKENRRRESGVRRRKAEDRSQESKKQGSGIRGQGSEGQKQESEDRSQKSE
jgi:hypothetical protein